MGAAMAGKDSSAKRPVSGFARRWAATGSTARRSYRTTFRLLAVPILAVAGVLVYRGLQDRFMLPECDSARAKDTLADVFKQLKIAPLRFEPIKTISTSNAEVVCNALLPLADGASVNMDYRFFWQGSTANMKYSISRREPQNSALGPPAAVPSR
jgi:hypothetical protein